MLHSNFISPMLSDYAHFNIMMDASLLFPKGFHPQEPGFAPDANGLAIERRRHQVPFPRYYVIDFGLSTWFKEEHEGPRLVTGKHCQDKSVPELNDTEPYDPFKVDIYTLGNLFKVDLLDVSSNPCFR